MKHKDNVIFDISLGDEAAAERSFAEAAKIVSLTLVCNGPAVLLR
jgi:hypothetical protein